jgi:hypothetical protein
VPTLDQLDMTPWIQHGIAFWAERDAAVIERLRDLRVVVQDLPGNLLGLGSMTSPTIWLDADGAGQGWLIGRHAQHGYDLVSVIAHEVGHVLGFPDLEATDDPLAMMHGHLRLGERRDVRVTNVEADSLLRPLFNQTNNLASPFVIPNLTSSRALPIPRIFSRAESSLSADQLDHVFGSDLHFHLPARTQVVRSQTTPPLPVSPHATTTKPIDAQSIDQLLADEAFFMADIESSTASPNNRQFQ